MRGRCHAHTRGFDLHAGIIVGAGQRERLERLCRYALRPPIAEDRLRVGRDGDVWLALRHRWADGTTHLTFDPVELLERLAALTPRPRVNLILYYGVLAPRAAWRLEAVGRNRSREPVESAATAPPAANEPNSAVDPRRTGGYLWADLMRRTLALTSSHVRAVVGACA